VFTSFSVCTISFFFFFFPYITIVVNLYSIGFCVYWFFSLYSTDYYYFSYITIVVNLYSTGFCVYWFFSLYSNDFFFFFLYNYCC
jgi:hypothetical protein